VQNFSAKDQILSFL
jgi:hypothetical protein